MWDWALSEVALLFPCSTRYLHNALGSRNMQSQIDRKIVFKVLKEGERNLVFSKDPSLKSLQISTTLKERRW